MKMIMNILKKDCKKFEAKDKSLPSNSYIITYLVKEKETYDIVQAGGFVEVFDHYYDEYGKGSIKEIKWTEGTANPRNYGYISKETKKKK